MGDTQSKRGENENSSSDEENGDWMEADKYAKWQHAGIMDYDAFVLGVSHVEMPLQSEEYRAATDHGITHEALVFDVMCTSGQRTKFTVELTYAGVLKRWGHHTNIIRVKNSKMLNLSISELLEKIKTNKKYNLVFYNCKTYAAEKFKELWTYRSQHGWSDKHVNNVSFYKLFFDTKNGWYFLVKRSI